MPASADAPRGAADLHVIVGAGEAGVAAALAMRDAGFAGRILLIGGERHAPYTRPPLSKDVLLAASPPSLPAQDSEGLQVRDIEFRAGSQVEGVEPAERRLRVWGPGGAERLPYDRLAFATGGAARRLEGLDAAGAFYLRTYDDALAIRDRLRTARRVLIVGGGVVGLELASAARALGAEAVVVETAERLMPRGLSPEPAAWLADLHRAHGVDLRLGVGIEELVPGRGEVSARLSDGETVAGDLLLAGIGMTPNGTLAADAGCATDDGVLVDAYGRTSVGGLYAAGDVARFFHPLFGERLRLESWQHARRHGAFVGRTMAGLRESYDETPWFWTDQHGRNIQVAGAPHLADHTVQRGGTPVWFHLRDGRPVGVTAIDAGREVRPAMTLIARQAPVDPAELADPSTPLRRLLAESTAAERLRAVAG